MASELSQNLSAAFHALEAFSLPGVGTFRKVYEPARVDALTRSILPPSERFVLEQGDHFVSHLEEFFFRSLKVSMDAARQLASDIAAMLRSEVEKKSFYHEKGVGKVKKEEGVYLLYAEALDEPDFFGLAPVNFTLGEPAELTAAEKQKVIEKRLEQNTIRVEAPAAPQKRVKVWPLMLLLLLICIGFSGYYFRHEIKTKLIAWGVMDSGGTAVVALPPDTTVPQTADTPAVPVDTQLAVHTQPEHQQETQPEKSPEVHKKPVPVVTSSDGNPILPASRDKFYLIVSASKSYESAQKFANELKRAKHKAEVTGGGTAMYRVSIFSSTKKADVIAKMVELKEQYPASWIFKK